MRNIAKQNYTIKETKEHRKPRIQFCGYSVNANSTLPVTLCKSTTGSIFFNGIANCGGYWRCPVCALKISEHKKQLLAGLIGEHQSRKQILGFLTLTVRHTKTDSLKKSLEKLLDNYRSFQNQRFFSRGKSEIGYMGQVKTLEITWSKLNGWHPHLHLLFFYDHSDTEKVESFQKSFISKWFKFKDNDGTLSAQHQTIMTGDVSEYMAKYDITSEMTAGQIKGSKGLTPFTALAKIAVGDFENHLEKRLLYGIYSHYVEYTQGRHFVSISPSLRKEYADYLSDKDKSDDEIVNEVEIDEILLKISVEVWKKICKNDLQPLIINKYKEGGLIAVMNLLNFFRDFNYTNNDKVLINSIDVEIDKDNYPVIV